jgi:hypothetical protein
MGKLSFEIRLEKELGERLEGPKKAAKRFKRLTGRYAPWGSD